MNTPRLISSSRAGWLTGGLMLLVGAVPVAGAEAVELKAKWPVGQRFVTRITMDQTQQIVGAPTGPITQKMNQVQEIAVDVVRKLEGGGRDLELQFLSMKMDMKMGSTTVMSYDSSQAGRAGANPLAGMMDNLVGTTLYMELDAEGQVVEVEGVKEMMNSLSGGGGMAASMLQGMFSEDSIKQMGVLPQGLPDRAVKVGDQWPYSAEFSMGPMGTIQIKMEFTFTGMEKHENRECAVLEYTGTLTSQAGGSSSPVSVSISEGTMKGKAWFDPEAGVMVENRGDQRMKMQVGAMGQQMTVNLTQDVNNKLVRTERMPPR